MAHTSFDHYDRHPQPNLQRIPYLEPFFNPLDPGPLPTVAPTTQHSPATLGAGRPLVRGDLREYSSSVRKCLQALCLRRLLMVIPIAQVASGSSPIHDFSQYPSTYGQPPCNGSHMLVSQHESSHSAMRIPHSQMQPAPASVVQSPSPIPSDLALQPPPTRHPIRTSSFPIQSVSPKEMISPTFQWVRDAGIRAPSSRRNSRRSNSVISSPHRPTRTSSAPVQPASPKEMALHICQWVGDDGMPCRAQITRADLSQHLAIHGVKGKAGDHRLSCRWLGCQLRGDRHTIKRESILRHVLEIHMGYRRVSK